MDTSLGRPNKIERFFLKGGGFGQVVGGQIILNELLGGAKKFGRVVRGRKCLEDQVVRGANNFGQVVKGGKQNWTIR